MQYRVATKEDLEREKTTVRTQWPFKDMSVGDKIVFNNDFGAKAQRCCHAYGAMYDMKFKSKKINSAGEIMIERIK